MACIGLPYSHKGFDQLCSSGTWLDATIALSTATLEYNRPMTLLNAAFNDLAALMDTRIMNNHNLAVSEPGLGFGSSRGGCDGILQDLD